MSGDKMEIQTASEALRFLWENGFFNGKKRRVGEIKTEIGKLGLYPQTRTSTWH
jgi:hypothetical protein